MSPHQCVRCGEKYLDTSDVLLKGCKCGSRFFFFYKQERVDKDESKILQELENLTPKERQEIEKEIAVDIEEIIENPEDKPIVLDLESVRIVKPGKFEIDLVSLFKRKPLIYKLSEGKYIIDLVSTFQLLKRDTKTNKRKKRK
jgi:predicted  nucleic acid-binding Zn-ribbon protein